MSFREKILNYAFIVKLEPQTLAAKADPKPAPRKPGRGRQV